MDQRGNFGSFRRGSITCLDYNFIKGSLKVNIFNSFSLFVCTNILYRFSHLKVLLELFFVLIYHLFRFLYVFVKLFLEIQIILLLCIQELLYNIFILPYFSWKNTVFERPRKSRNIAFFDKTNEFSSRFSYIDH
jgi:hypothetical protein